MISVGLFTAKLDHFFIAAPYRFFFACWHVWGSAEILEPRKGLTSNVIQEIGSFSGIGVLLIKFKVNCSSSNSKVKIAPGGVQVPTIK